MMPPEGKKKCLPLDVLSNLPENVIDDILMNLPLQDAIRTSILSKRWRYKWCGLPELTIDQALWKSERNLTDPTSNFTKIIYHILTLHVGPITKFTLSIPHLRPCPSIGYLVYFLSKNDIQHLVLELPYLDTYTLPSLFFTCLYLRHLSLQKCLICPPPGFKGFDRLITLELRLVTIASDFPGSLISLSPLLEHLVLAHVYTTHPIEIDAPKLKSLVVTGNIHNICLRNVPLLAKVSVLFFEHYEPSGVKEGKHDLAKFFESIPALEHLLWEGNMFQHLTDKAVEVPRRLSSALSCLKHLYMNLLCPDDLHNLQSALCLIRSSPYLQDIEIEMYQRFYPDKLLDPAIRDYVDEIPASFSDVTLNHLREVKLKGIAGTRPEMQLIKLLLAKSPALVKMVIDPYYALEYEKSLEVVAEIAKFQLASSKAEVVYNVA